MYWNITFLWLVCLPCCRWLSWEETDTMRRRDKSSLSRCADQGILCSVCRCSTPRLESVCTPENRFHLMKFLPPANEVWGKVICLQVCACPQGGGLVEGVPAPGSWFAGVCSGGVPAPGGGGWSGEGGCLVRGGGAWWRPPWTASAAGSTHPTGMHSC